MYFSRFATALTVLAAPLALAACADPAPLYVDRAWVQLNPNGEGPAAGYFTVHGGEEAVKLLRVSSEAAQRIEMHESISKDGMMTMQPVESVDIPAKGEVKFAPGGKHLMIFNVNPAIVESGKLTMVMMFSNGDRLIVDAPIQKGGNATGGQQAMGGIHDGAAKESAAKEGDAGGEHASH